MEEPEIQMTRETVEIEGRRKLYNYKFTLHARPSPTDADSREADGKPEEQPASESH